MANINTAAPKVLAILQARMSSNRLPGKVLKKILGKPMLALHLERLQASTRIDQLVVATSDEPSDDGIEHLCQQLKVNCFRGSLNNVLDRFYQAAQQYNQNNSIEHIVRLTGDCPLADSEIIDQLIIKHINSDACYSSNVVPATYPDGLDAEIFPMTQLASAWKNASSAFELEHVTPYIREHCTNMQNLNFQRDTSHHRWTVDLAEDFELVTRIYETLYPINPRFTFLDTLKFVENNAELSAISTRKVSSESSNSQANAERFRTEYDIKI